MFLEIIARKETQRKPNISYEEWTQKERNMTTTLRSAERELPRPRGRCLLKESWIGRQEAMNWDDVAPGTHRP